MGLALFHHLFRAIGGFAQKWTKQDVPQGINVLHDFGDGEGAVPAAPVDKCGIEVGLQSLRELAPLHNIEEACGMSVALFSLHELTSMQVVSDECGIGVSLVSLTELT